MTPLTANAVDGADLEGTTLALWAEWLGRYFDGAAHAIGAGPAQLFPKAELRFQESRLPQQLADGPAGATVGINVVYVSPPMGNTRLLWEAATVPPDTATRLRNQRAQARCVFLFLVRSATASGDGNAQKQVQRAAGLLHGLLQNNRATQPMAAKGLTKLRPVPPRMAFPGSGAPPADLGYRLRIVSCTSLVRWLVYSTPET